MRIPADAWGEVGNALYEVPDTELAALAATLHDLAMASPGRAADVLHGFADMVETERQWREAAMKPPLPQPPKRHLPAVGG
jgi:hypothetical protein